MEKLGPEKCFCMPLFYMACVTEIDVCEVVLSIVSVVTAAFCFFTRM